MTKLSEKELQVRSSSLPRWKVESGELVRTLEFTDFRKAIAFVNQIAEDAERANHHPDIDIRYNKVKLVLVTHDAGGLTAKDFDLAEAIDKRA